VTGVPSASLREAFSAGKVKLPQMPALVALISVFVRDSSAGRGFDTFPYTVTLVICNFTAYKIV